MNEDLNQEQTQGLPNSADQESSAVGKEEGGRSPTDSFPTAAAAAGGGADQDRQCEQGPFEEVDGNAGLPEELDWDEPPPKIPNLKARARGSLSKKPERPRMPISPQ